MFIFNLLKKSQRVKNLIWIFKKVLYFLQDLKFILASIFLNIYRLKKLYKKDIIFVSAASEKYFSYLLNLLDSIRNINFTKVIVYDLGLTENQVLQLKDTKNIELVKFDFSKYPSFVSQKQQSNENKIGAYSWKAVIIKDVFYKYKMQVVWLDSANLITKRFKLLRIALTRLGYFTSYSKDSVERWTHDSVIEKLNLNSKLLKKINLNAAIIGFDYDDNKSKELLDSWHVYCLEEDLISPQFSSKDNHRWDQSLLSIVFHKSRLNYIPKLHNFYGVKTHQWKDREFFIVQSDNEEDIIFRQNWYKQFGHVSTNTFKDSKKVIFLNYDSFKRFPKWKLSNKISYIFLQNQNDIEKINSKNLKPRTEAKYFFHQNLDVSNLAKNIEFKNYSIKTAPDIKQLIDKY